MLFFPKYICLCYFTPCTFIIEYIVNIIFIFIFVCGKRENNIDIYLTEKREGRKSINPAPKSIKCL